MILATFPVTDVDDNAAMVNALQRHASVIVQKSLAEGFGLTVAEGMWKGRPVVGSAVGGIQDQIADGTGILLPDPTDLPAFGRAVRTLLDDPELAARLGAAAREYVRAHYVGDQHLLRYAELFGTLLATEHRLPPRVAGSAEVRVVSVSPGPAAAPPVTQKREFWVLMGYAVALGVFGAVAGLVFIGVIKFGGKWYSDSDPGWFGGHWWWVAVAAAAGAVVGLLRRLTRLPQEVPGLFADLQDEHVDPRLVPGIVAVSTVSLIGGASLGPEKALGAMGGGAGSWLAQRRALSKEDSQVNTLAGFAGAYGGLFSSTVIVVLLILEVARPGGQRFTKALAAEIVASSVSFGIYFAIAGAVFLDDYQVPPYKFEDWQLLAGVPLGLFAALVVTLLAGFMMAAARLFGRLKAPAIAKSTLGGLVFGIVGVALPLTMFSGSDQLTTVLNRRGDPGRGPARRHPDRQDAHLRRQPGQRLRRRAHLPLAVHRRNRRGPRPPGHPRRATGTGVHLPARRRPRGAHARAVLHGADGRVPDPGRGAADRTHPDRRRHLLPHHGGRQVPPGQPQTGPRSRGETSSPGLRRIEIRAIHLAVSR